MTPDAERKLIGTAGERGEPSPDLSERLYTELRAMCAQALMSERANHTLQPTALTHEVFLRLFSGPNRKVSPPNEFKLAASVAIRRILVEYGRSRGRIKRGGGYKRAVINLDGIAVQHSPEEIACVDEIMQAFQEEFPRQARVVDLCFFGNYTQSEAAEIIGVSERTVREDWRFVRAWFNKRMRDRDESTQ